MGQPPPLQIALFRSAYPEMTRKEKRIAAYIEAHAATIMEETISELAAHTESSEITISRFCKKLGFPGLQSLKIALASEIQPQDSEVFGEICQGDAAPQVAAKVFQNIADGLQDTLKSLDYEALDSAAALLLAARCVFVFGVGNSATVAKDIETRFLRFGLSIHAYADTHQQVTAAAVLQPGDVVIAVSHTGGTLELLESVALAKAGGAHVIALTSYPRSRLAREAGIVLSGRGREVRYSSEAVASRLVHMAVTDVLYTRMAMLDSARYRENMKKMREAIAKKRI